MKSSAEVLNLPLSNASISAFLIGNDYLILSKQMGFYMYLFDPISLVSLTVPSPKIQSLGLVWLSHGFLNF